VSFRQRLLPGLAGWPDPQPGQHGCLLTQPGQAAELGGEKAGSQCWLPTSETPEAAPAVHGILHHVRYLGSRSSRILRTVMKFRDTGSDSQSPQTFQKFDLLRTDYGYNLRSRSVLRPFSSTGAPDKHCSRARRTAEKGVDAETRTDTVTQTCIQTRLPKLSPYGFFRGSSRCEAVSYH
jgi:hypothetical protein